MWMTKTQPGGELERESEIWLLFVIPSSCVPAWAGITVKAASECSAIRVANERKPCWFAPVRRRTLSRNLFHLHSAHERVRSAGHTYAASLSLDSGNDVYVHTQQA